MITSVSPVKGLKGRRVWRYQSSNQYQNL